MVYSTEASNKEENKEENKEDPILPWLDKESKIKFYIISEEYANLIHGYKEAKYS
jgi:hypothetical protein